MDQAGPSQVGLFGSARRLGRLLLALLHSRAELFAVEFRQEKVRNVHLVVWLTVALALLVAGILITLGVVGLFLWERAGYAGVIGLAVVVLGAAAGLLRMILHRIVHGPPPFPETLAQFGKDLECLRHHE